MMAPGTTLKNEHTAWGVRDLISLLSKRVKMKLMTVRFRKSRPQWVFGFPGGA